MPTERPHQNTDGDASRPAPVQVSAKGVGKKFDIYVNDRGRVFELFTRKNYHEEFWALKDLTFEVPRGSAYGIIGSNGAGKSTLLKLLAGVSRPTEGQLKVNASISSLLDLGLGFHQAFTGRQNIYLNCTLLGLSRPEIDARLPDIVAFAELESFIDYPVKTYSSGMNLRLGFAIASHLDYEIFLIDEVLTVGDQYFQRKCVRKIEEFIDQGRTIVLVSHDLHSVRSLCDRVLWLKEGRIVADGPAPDVVDAYVDAVRSREGGGLRARPLPLSAVRRPQAEEARPIRRPQSEEGPGDAGTGGEGQVSTVGGALSGASGEGLVELLLQVLEPGEQGGGLPGSGSSGISAGSSDISAGSSDISAGSSDISAGSSGTSAGSSGTSAGSSGTSAGSSGTSAGSSGISAGNSADDAQPGGPDAEESSPPEDPTASVEPHRAETAARYRPSQRRKSRKALEAPYRSTSDDPILRRRLLAATALANAAELWQPGESVQPLMEYHGDLPLVTGSGEARILEVLILGPDGQPREEFYTSDAVTIAVTIKALEPVDNPIFGVAIHRNDDVYVYGPNTRFDRCLKGTYHGLYTFFLHYPALPLLAGTYLLSVALWDKHHLKPYVWHNRLYPISFRADREDHGLVVLPHTWGVVTHVSGEQEDLEAPVIDEPDDGDGP